MICSFQGLVLTDLYSFLSQRRIILIGSRVYHQVISILAYKEIIVKYI
jgi:hypothetical protein